MAAGIVVNLVANVREFVSGLRKGTQSVEDLADELDDVQRDGVKAGDAVGDGFTDAGKDIDKSTDELRRFSDVLDQVRDDARRTGRSIGDDTRAGTREAGEGFDEFRDEANSTARESAASFDGSAESVVDSFQEIAANAFAGFGPAGAVAGLAAAAGVGIVTSKLQEAKDKAQETAEEIADIAGQLIEVGSSSLGADQVVDALNELATTAEDGKIPLDELRKQADAAGISFADYARGVAGDSGALRRSYDEVNREIDAQSDALSDLANMQNLSTDEVFEAGKAGEAHLEALGKTREALLKQDATLDRASGTARNFADATKDLTGATKEQTDAIEAAQAADEAYAETLRGVADPVDTYTEVLDRKNDAEQAAAQATADATEDSADSWEDYAKAATVSVDDLIAEWNKQAEQARAFESNLATIAAAGGQALADELRAKGPEVAGAVAEVIATSDPATQKQAIEAHAGAAGTAIGASMAGGITAQGPTVQTAVNGVITSITTANGIVIPVKLDMSKAQADYSAYVQSLKPIVVPIRGVPQRV